MAFRKLHANAVGLAGVSSLRASILRAIVYLLQSCEKCDCVVLFSQRQTQPTKHHTTHFRPNAKKATTFLQGKPTAKKQRLFPPKSTICSAPCLPKPTQRAITCFEANPTQNPTLCLKSKIAQTQHTPCTHAPHNPTHPNPANLVANWQRIATNSPQGLPPEKVYKM
jgi:hypothetical protein